MSQVRSGTVSVTFGSPALTASPEADWSSVLAGDLFSIQGSGVTYQIAAAPVKVGLNWTAVLTSNYGGSTASNAAYILHRSFTTNYGIPIVESGDTQTAAILKKAMIMVDSLLHSLEVGGSVSSVNATCKVENASMTLTATGTLIKAVFNSVVHDPSAAWDSSNDEYVIPASGRYLIVASIRRSLTGTQSPDLGFGVGVSVSESDPSFTRDTTVSASYGTVVSTATFVDVQTLASGQRISLRYATRTAGTATISLKITKV